MIILALIAAQAMEPPRQTDFHVASNQSLSDLQACAMRELARYGRVLPVPLDNGVALDFQITGALLAGGGKSLTTFEIRDGGDTRDITVGYRHPFSIRSAYNMLRDLAGRCFPAEWEAAALEKPKK